MVAWVAVVVVLIGLFVVDWVAVVVVLIGLFVVDWVAVVVVLIGQCRLHFEPFLVYSFINAFLP